jgi:hypothetical protein
MSLKKSFLHIAPMLTVLMLPLLTAQVLPQSTTQPTADPAAKNAPKQPAVHAKEDEGVRIFSQNCSRCHNAPDGFSPRISGTVVRHMRIRASLSKHDEEELLRFLNP